MIRCRTKSVEDTQALASELSSLARAGDVILLAGDLATGKTAFAQGFGAGLGVREPITSPTFILMRAYEGRLPLVHLDVYRLEHLQEAVDLGLAEILDDGAVALIEWGDVVAPVLPADFLEVRLDRGADDDERHLRFRAVGPGWSPRMGALHAAVDRWMIGSGREDTC
jgi:tRNA threonylcarbamoyladenosine biosynthesis protein TsaE